MSGFCPYCSQPFDMVSAGPDTPIRPFAGALVICFFCARCLIFAGDDDGILRKPTLDESIMLTHSEFVRDAKDNLRAFWREHPEDHPAWPKLPF